MKTYSLVNGAGWRIMLLPDESSDYSSRKGTRWDLVVFVLAAYRLIAPGREWRLHR